MREKRWRFENRAETHDIALARRLRYLILAELKTRDTAGTPDYTEALDRYNRLGTNYDKEKTARNKATARAENLRQEEEILAHQIQTLNENIPVPLTHFVEYGQKLNFIAKDGFHFNKSYKEDDITHTQEE